MSALVEAPTAAAERRARLRRLAGTVGAFWGEGIRVEITGGPPSFDWRVVNIPSDEVTARDDASLTCLLLHEWGHRCLAPRTVPQAIWWELLARLEGIGASRAAVNIACDLLVDRWYLEHPAWSEAYALAERAALVRVLGAPGARAQAKRDPAMGLLLACYEQVGGWNDVLGDLSLDRELANRALAALFDESQVLDERLRGFFRVGAAALRGSQLLNEMQSGLRVAPGGESLPPLLGSPTPWIGQGWDAGELVRLLASRPLPLAQSVLEEVCGRETATEVRVRLRVMESLLRVEQAVERTVTSVRRERAEGSELWRIGDPSHELDALLTLERAGIIVPGITTLRRRRASRPVPKPNLPRLVLVIDNSGSTAGEIVSAELDAAVALLEAARRLEVEAGAIVFGSSVHAAVDPGPHHRRIAHLLAGLRGQSGGTALAPALQRACAMLPSNGAAMGTVVFTDSWIFDTNEALHPMRELISRGPAVVFVAGHVYDRGFLAALGTLQPGPRVVLFHPGQVLVDDALRVLQ